MDIKLNFSAKNIAKELIKYSDIGCDVRSTGSSDILELKNYPVLKKEFIQMSSACEIILGTFPVREMSEDATQEISEILDITNRDRRIIFEKLGLESSETKKDEVFYGKVLDILEGAPWFIILMNEWVAVTKQKNSKYVKSILGRIHKHLYRKYGVDKNSGDDQVLLGTDESFEQIFENIQLTIPEKFLAFLCNIEDCLADWLRENEDLSENDRASLLLGLITHSLKLEPVKTGSGSLTDVADVYQSPSGGDLESLLKQADISFKNFLSDPSEEFKVTVNEIMAKIMDTKRVNEESREKKLGEIFSQIDVISEGIEVLTDADREKLKARYCSDEQEMGKLFELVSILAQGDEKWVQKKSELSEAKEKVSQCFEDDSLDRNAAIEHFDQINSEYKQCEKDRDSALDQLRSTLNILDEEDNPVETVSEDSGEDGSDEDDNPVESVSEDSAEDRSDEDNNQVESVSEDSAEDRSDEDDNPVESVSEDSAEDRSDEDDNPVESVSEDSAEDRSDEDDNPVESVSEESAEDSSDEESVQVQPGGEYIVDDASKWYSIIAMLIEDDKLAIAARLCMAIKRSGRKPPIDPRVLVIAAADKLNFEDPILAPDTKQLDLLILEVKEELKNHDQKEVEFEETLLLGALLKPALFQYSEARSTIKSLRNEYGQKVNEIQNELANLKYEFKILVNDPKDVSDAQPENKIDLLRKEIAHWYSSVEEPSTRNPNMREVIKKMAADKDLKKLVEKILNNSTPVENEIRVVEKKFSQPKVIEEQIRSNERRKNKIQGALLNSIKRDFEKGWTYINSYLLAIEGSEFSLKHRKNSRQNDFEKTNAIKKLSNQALQEMKRLKPNEDILKKAIVKFLIARLETFNTFFLGRLSSPSYDLQRIVSVELDLLPTGCEPQFAMPFETCSKLDMSAILIEEDERIIKYFYGWAGTPSQRDSYEEKIEKGGFHTAVRLAKELAISSEEEYEKYIDQIEYEHREMRAKYLQRIKNKIIDLRLLANHQTKDMRDALEDRKSDLEEGGLLYDPPSQENSFYSQILDTQIRQMYMLEPILAEATDLGKRIEKKFREDQRQKIIDLKKENPSRVEDIKYLLDRVDKKDAVHTIDEKIQQFESGLPLEGFEPKKLPLDSFHPKFIQMATEENNWPKNPPNYESAFKGEGEWPKELSLDGDDNDKAAAKKIIEKWFGIKYLFKRDKSPKKAYEELLDSLEIPYRNLRPGKPKDSFKLFHVNIDFSQQFLSARKQYFVPPVFGSESKTDFQLVVCNTRVTEATLERFLAAGPSKFVPKILLWPDKLDVRKRKDLSKIFRENRLPVLLIDEVLIAFLASYSSRDRLGVLFDCTVPFGYVQPYSTDAGKLAPEMFYGRSKEIDQILSRTQDGTLVYGGRQLGKSALLHHLKIKHHDPKKGFIVLREDIKDYGRKNNPANNIWGLIKKELSKQDNGVIAAKNSEPFGQEEIISAITSWLNMKSSRRILILLDETDNFMASEASNYYPNVTKLKELMENTGRGFKVVFAGLHNVLRVQTAANSNSPLRHLGAICIGPLTKTKEDLREARALVEDPMRAAGFEFKDRGKVDDILDWVQHYPSLIQIFMREFITSFKPTDDGPLHIIDEENILRGEIFEQIQKQVETRFDMTLELDPWFKLITACVAILDGEYRKNSDWEITQKGYSADIIWNEVSEWRPHNLNDIPIYSFKNFLDGLVEFGVLSSKEGRYRFRSKTVRELIGTEEKAQETLETIAEFEQAEDYDASIYCQRIRRKDVWERFPLPDDQLDMLLDSKNSNIRIIIGLEVLGVLELPQALKTICEQKKEMQTSETAEKEVILNVDILTNPSNNEISKSIQNYSGKKKILIIQLDKTATNENLYKIFNFLKNGTAVVNGNIFPVIILNAHEKTHREYYSEMKTADYNVSLFSLAPWGKRMFRAYLRDLEEVSILEKNMYYEKIQNITGGVPNEILKVVKRFKDAQLTLDDEIINFLDEQPDVVLDFELESDLVRFLKSIKNSKVLDFSLPKVASTAEEYDFIKDIIEEDGIDFRKTVDKFEMLTMLQQHSPSRGILHFSRLAARLMDFEIS